MQNSIDPRRQSWLPYVRLIADMYGLKDWVIEIDNDGPTDRNAYASIYMPPGRKMGYLRLSQFFLDETLLEQRMIIVHELTHCHWHTSYSFAQDFLAEDKKLIHSNLMEFGVDGISVAIAPFFPLPPGEEHEVTCTMMQQRKLRTHGVGESGCIN